MPEVNAVTLKSWLLGARPEPDENKLHLGGFLLVLFNLIMISLGWLAPATGIGIADRYSCEAVSLLPTYTLIIPFFAPLIALAALALRRYFKSRLGYYACNALIIICSLASLLVICRCFYITNYILHNFQPLH